MNRKKRKINILPSVGTAPVKETADFIISLLAKNRKKENKIKLQKNEK